MAFEFTNSGLTIDSFDDIYNRLSDGLKAIYGSDINLDPNSPDGQRLGIFVKELIDVQSFAQVLYSNLDVDFSFGSFQDVIIKLIGVTRLPATRSSVDLTVVTDRNLTLDAGYTRLDTNGNEWITLSSNSLVAGSNTVTFVAKEFGNVEATPGTIIEVGTVVLGVISTTNALAATAGRDEETDAELRRRRNRSLEINAFSTLGSSIGKIAQLQGVTDVVGFENDTDAVDANGLNPHSVYFVIEGGELADIAEILTKNKTAGAGYNGSTSATYNETIERENLPDFMISHTVLIDRPTLVDLQVRVNARRTVIGQAVDTALIAEKIASREYLINEDAFTSALYAFGYQAGTNFALYDLEISKDGVTYTDETIVSLINEKFTIDASNVVVTEII